MIVVADTSPLIFLAKIDALDWLPRLFDCAPLLPSRVAEELLRPPVPPAELRLLRAFVGRCEIVTVADPTRFSAALSDADNAVLTLAVARKAQLLLADDRVLRSMARVEGIVPMGTLGILLAAVDRRLARRDHARGKLRALVRQHGYRIGVEVYDLAMERLEGE